MRSFFVRRALAAAVLGAIAAPSFATTVACVDTVAKFQNALTAAKTAGEDTIIRVVTGTYTFNSPIQAGLSTFDALTIEGGYSTNCPVPPTTVPDSTIFAAQSGSNASFSLSNGGSLTLRSLTFKGFKPPAGTNVLYASTFGANSLLKLEFLSVLNNGVNGINDSVVKVFVGGALTLDNTVIHDNTNSAGALTVGAFYPGGPITVANNTIASNGGTGVNFNVYTLLPAALYNNVIWNNSTEDLLVVNTDSAQLPLAMNNTYASCNGCTNFSPLSANNNGLDPKLTATYRLALGSPAINTGMPVPLVEPSVDAQESARVTGSAPDRGAYESNVDDFSGHTYTVLSTADDAGSLLTLRGAITAANAAGVPARIAIHFSSGCPQALVPTSPYPSIKVPMQIDGYADPNSMMNTSAGGVANNKPFNATLCTILFGNTTSPQLDHAFAIDDDSDPTVHLEVRGIRFANFANAIHLSGGNGNWIHGNAFETGFLGGFVGNGVAVNVDAGVATTIGGRLTADVNLISSGTGAAGVLLGGGTSSGWHIVNNNNIGADAGSFANHGNAGSGVLIQDAIADQVSNNWIVANNIDGVRIDDSVGTLVQNNTIGSNSAAGLGNVEAGVRITNNAYRNWIGSTDPGYAGGSNALQNNNGPGVWVDNTSSSYNQVSDDRMSGNAGLAMDVSNLGVSPYTGPSGFVASPQLTKAVVKDANNIEVTGSIVGVSANAYRTVSLYASDTCGNVSERLYVAAAQADATGTLKFDFVSPKPKGPASYIVAFEDTYTAGATETSEISNSRPLAVSDDLFIEHFDCH